MPCLLFFRGKPGGPYDVIRPGGGFSYAGSIHEGFPHMLALSGKGYNWLKDKPGVLQLL
jgi:hypothetical protein